MRYAVDTAALREDVTSITEVLARVRTIGIADELQPIAAALPGSRSAAGLRQVSAVWGARLAATRWELQELGQCLTVAADTYDAVEQAARQSVRPASGGSR